MLLFLVFIVYISLLVYSNYNIVYFRTWPLKVPFTGLKNDLHAVMQEIEIGLHEVHALAKEKRIQSQDEQMDTSTGKWQYYIYCI